ncbi:MAG TPA: hypothetical protein VFZ69_12395 [Longimicrobiales bacterium]
METHLAYCSACDHDVRVAITDPPVYADQATLAEPQIVCLDFASRCSGAICPMFGLPRILMGVRLAQSGLRPEAFTTVSAPCPACDTVVDLQLIDDAFAYCPNCGSRSRWVRLQVGDADYIALAQIG